KLRFRLENHRRGNICQFDGSSGSHEIRRLVKVFVRQSVRTSVGPVHVIHEGGEAFARSRYGAKKLHAAQWYAVLACKNFFKAAPVLAPTLDDLFHDPLRTLGLASADCIAHIHDHVFVFYDADSIVVKSKNFQSSPLTAVNLRLSLR